MGAASHVSLFCVIIGPPVIYRRGFIPHLQLGNRRAVYLCKFYSQDCAVCSHEPGSQPGDLLYHRVRRGFAQSKAGNRQCNPAALPVDCSHSRADLPCGNGVVYIFFIRRVPISLRGGHSLNPYWLVAVLSIQRHGRRSGNITLRYNDKARIPAANLYALQKIADFRK